MMYKVTVIVPVYRVASYIGRCMDSLRGQTLAEVEVLLVDDCSPDESVALVNDYIVRNHLETDWHILHTPYNSGPGVARNIGIAAAGGEYIAYVDGDDWIEPQMLESLYAMAKRQDADLSSSAAILDYPDGSHRLMTNPVVGCGEVTEAKRKHLLRHFVSNFTTTLFRREWLRENGITFPSSMSGEDSCYMGMCYLMCRRIAQCDTPYYHYIIYPESTSHRRHVYRGREKRKAFGALLAYAQKQGLWEAYKGELRLIYLKKAVLTSIIDYIKSYL